MGMTTLTRARVVKLNRREVEKCYGNTTNVVLQFVLQWARMKLKKKKKTVQMLMIPELFYFTGHP